MSKQFVLLALASMMLLALAVEAAELMPSSDYAEVQKRHKSKYGAPKDKDSDKYEGHRKHRREHKDKPEPKDKPEYKDKEEPEYKDKEEPEYKDRPEYKGKDKYKADEPKAPKYEKKDEPRYKTHEDDKHDEYYAPRRDYGDDYLRNYGQDPRTPEKQRYGEYNIEVPDYNERRRGEYYGGDDGYGEDDYYSDAYDRGDYDGKWCKGETLQDALVNALWKFEDLHLFKHAVMLAELVSLKIAKNASLTIFAPDNHAMKELPELLGKEDLHELFDDETLLSEFVASTITNQGKFMTWDFTTMNTPKNLTTLDPVPPATTLTVRVQPTRLGMSHEITVESDGRPGEEATICRPSNIKVCKAVIHTVDAPLVPRRA